MRAIAEFVMRGRYQAMGVSLISASLPPPFSWLSPMVINLVILRKGIGEGALTLLAGSLPLVAVLVLYQNINPLVGLVGTACLALVLRLTVSLEFTLVIAVVASIIGSLIFEFTAIDVINNRAVDYLTMLRNFKAGSDSAAGMILPTVQETRDSVSGFFAMGLAFSMIAFLGMARWWQSLLYNPGGFGQEFRVLRLSPQFSGVLVLALLLLGLAASTGIWGFLRWWPLLVLPLLLASAGFVHWFVAEKKLSGIWLIGFYLVLIVMSHLVAVLALFDSWLDLRKRMRFDRGV